MSVKSRGNGYQVDVKLGETRYRPLFVTEAEALSWEADARHAQRQGRPIKLPGSSITQGGGRIVTIGDLFDNVSKNRWATANAKSSAYLIRNGRIFCEWIGRNRDITTIKSVDLYAYVDHCRSIGNENATINRKISAARTMLRDAVRKEIIPGIPYVEKFKESQGSMNYLDFHEEDPILTHLGHRGFDQLVDLVIFLADTGCRITEALTVEWGTISKTHVRFENRKNGGWGVVPLSKRANVALERRRLNCANPDRPFGDFKYKWATEQLNAVYQTLGGRYLTITQPCHVFRHSCASRLAIIGVDASRIKEWMDHSSLIVTQRYIKLAPKDLDVALSALERGNTKHELKVIKGARLRA